MNSTVEWRGQDREKKSVNWKIEQWKLPNTNNRRTIDWGGRRWIEESPKDLWDYNRRSNICVIRVPGKEKEGGAEKENY